MGWPGFRNAFHADKNRSFGVQVAKLNLVRLCLLILGLLCFGVVPIRANEDPAVIFLNAAAKGEVAIVETLLKQGVPIDSQTKKEGYTALMLAAAEGHTNVLKFLIDSGAKLNAHAKRRETAVHLAAMHCKKETLEMLLAHKAESKLTDTGLTPLMLAASSGCDEIVELLLANGEKINGKQYDGWTALMHAAAKNRASTVSLLLAKGANAAAKTQKHETALDIATRYRHKQVIEILKSSATAPAK